MSSKVAVGFTSLTRGSSTSSSSGSDGLNVRDDKMGTKQVVIVGAGPAGMMLAYQLSSNGARVRVIERHPDFDREFRGELVQGSNVEELEKAGIFQLLLNRGLAIPNIERRMFLGHTRQVA